ncbi:MAG: GntR family transcriptional regulator, partial [Desulfarculaceae bacterium]
MPNKNHQQKRPKVEIVTDLLRRMIFKGELAPGRRLMEEDIARLSGASRTPVREALHCLEKEKLIVRRKSTGFEVRPLNPREIKE